MTQEFELYFHTTFFLYLFLSDWNIPVGYISVCVWSLSHVTMYIDQSIVQIWIPFVKCGMQKDIIFIKNIIKCWSFVA